MKLGDFQKAAGGKFATRSFLPGFGYLRSDYSPCGGMIISTSSVIVTSSPTTTPPLSSFWFHATPNSCRLILVDAETAVRCKPQGSLMAGLGTDAVRMALLVTPRMVRSPVIFKLPSLLRSILVD